MPKHWDYEDDHDWDDNIDYEAMGHKYWYGKYYPKEDIDPLFKNPGSEPGLLAFLAIVGVAVAGVYGVFKGVPHLKNWWANTFNPIVKKASQKNSQEKDR